MDSLPFEATLQARPPASLTPAAPPSAAPRTSLWSQRTIVIGVAVVFVIGLLTFFLLLQSRKKTRAVIADLQKQLEAAKVPAETALVTHSAADEPSASDESVGMGGNRTGGRQTQLAEIKEAFKLPVMTTTKAEILTKQVTEEARKDPIALAQIIRTWLNESDRS